MPLSAPPMARIPDPLPELQRCGANAPCRLAVAKAFLRHRIKGESPRGIFLKSLLKQSGAERTAGSLSRLTLVTSQQASRRWEERWPGVG